MVNSTSRAKSIVNDHPAGTNATAYVVGGDGVDAYLIESDMPWWYYLIPGFGSLLFVLGVWNLLKWGMGYEPLARAK